MNYFFNHLVFNPFFKTRSQVNLFARATHMNLDEIRRLAFLEFQRILEWLPQ
jgi:hypothetical protein